MKLRNKFALIIILILIPSLSYGGATFSRLKTWSSGETLTAAQLNSEFNNILNNLDPSGIDDESSTDTLARTTTDPYPGSVLTKATSLRDEIRQIRYLLAQITGESYWYIDPDISLALVVSDDAYGTSWNGITTIAPSKNAVYDKIASLTTIATDPIWDTAGDIVQGTGSNTASKLPIGTAGQIPVVNSGATALAYEGGVWITPSFDAGNFTASASMTWTVEAGDVTTYAYCIIGKIMYLNVFVADTTVGGTPSYGLIVAVPGGKTIAKSFYATAKVSDNGTGSIGYIRGNASGTTIQCNLSDDSNWAASTNATIVGFSVTFEIQ